MKAVIIALCVLVAAGSGHCGHLSTTAALLHTPSAVVRSERLGSSFAYSTVESHAYTPFSSPFYTHQFVASNPLLSAGFFIPGLFAQNPFLDGQQQPVQIAQHPTFGVQQQPEQIAQNPIFGVQQQHPVQIAQNPIFGGQFPAAPPAAPDAGALSPTPVQGEIVDDDTVAVDSA